MSDLLGLNAVAAREALDKKAISAVELTTAYLGAAEATVGLNNYVALTADHALAMAAESDKRISSGAQVNNSRPSKLVKQSRSCASILRIKAGV